MTEGLLLHAKGKRAEGVTFKTTTEWQKDPAMRRPRQESDQVSMRKGCWLYSGDSKHQTECSAKKQLMDRRGQLGSWLLPNELLAEGWGGSADGLHPCLLTCPRNTSTCAYKEGAPHRKAGYHILPPWKFQVPFCFMCQPELSAFLSQEKFPRCVGVVAAEPVRHL